MLAYFDSFLSFPSFLKSDQSKFDISVDERKKVLLSRLLNADVLVVYIFDQHRKVRQKLAKNSNLP
jgi:hypothetical protein